MKADIFLSLKSNLRTVNSISNKLFVKTNLNLVPAVSSVA